MGNYYKDTEMLNKLSIMKGVLFGTIIGTALGLLFAKKSGEETREELKSAVNDIKEDIAERKNTITDSFKQKKDNLVCLTQKVKHDVQDKKQCFSATIGNMKEDTAKG